MTTISNQAIREATAWLVELTSGEATEKDKQRWQEWHAGSEENRSAWSRVEQLQSQFRQLPADIIHRAVKTADKTSKERRALLKGMLSIAIIAPIAYTGSRQLNWHADYRTAVGGMTKVTLKDGTEVLLNTNTALVVEFNTSLRAITLLQGELLITTSKSNTESRPFIVNTAHGSVRALGTRFSVRLDDQYSHVSVFESATMIHTKNSINKGIRLDAGFQADFNQQQVINKSFVDESRIAWSRNMLIVDNWTLGEFIQELSRYRPGHLSCRASVADLRISGSFPLQDTNRILASLSNTLPVQVHTLSRYITWVDKR